MPATKEELLRAFTHSKERGTATGLRIQGRASLLITTIEEIVDNVDAPFVVVNSTSIYGESSASTRIAHADIEQILTLRVHFNDPFYVKLRSLRKNIQVLRYNSGEGSVSLA